MEKIILEEIDIIHITTNQHDVNVFIKPLRRSKFESLHQTIEAISKSLVSMLKILIFNMREDVRYVDLK
jgi:hypothetical protein